MHTNGLTVFISLFFATTTIAQNVAPLPVAAHSFIVIAHRGDHTGAPENTLAAYQNAINAEADFVEIDLRTSKDSELVIMHDASLLRMTGRKAFIKDMIADSLKQLKVFYPQHSEFGTYPIPTFREVLRLCKNKINIYLDFKDASVKQAYAMIKEEGMEKNILVYINSLQQLTDWKKIAPEMPLMLSIPNTVITKDDLFDFVDRYGIAALDGNYNEYSKELLLSAEEKHVAVWPDIQSFDDESNWTKATNLGIKGLQTDHPKALVSFLKKKGLR
jgi:glycerophosphoryl diester phosphodiesterase